MAYREFSVTEIREVLRIWLKGKGFRAVAQLCNVDRKTVRRYIEVAQELGVERPSTPGTRVVLSDELIGQIAQSVLPGRATHSGAMRQHCEKHRAALEQWVEEGIKAPKLAELLHRSTGIVVPGRTLRRFVAEDLGRSRKPGPTVRVADGEPGVELQVDFTDLAWVVDPDSGKRRKLQALVMTPNCSRCCFVWPCWQQTTPTIIEALEAAWQFYGGVFAVLIPDNCKGIVTRADPLTPTLTRDFVEYMQFRDFHCDPARVRSPQDKGRVESDVSYVQGSMWAGEKFTTLAEARQLALRWCTDVAGQRNHGTMHRKPMDVFTELEMAHLMPAPAEPYDPPRWGKSMVGRDQMLIVDKVLYSMPDSLIGKELAWRQDRCTVKAYLGAVLVKSHVRGKVGKAQMDPTDFAAEVLAYALRDTEGLLRQAQGYGDSVAAFAQKLLENPMPWSRIRHVSRLLGLCKSYGGPAVNGACRQLLAIDVPEVSKIEKIIVRGLPHNDVAPPPPSGGRVIALRFARSAGEFSVKMQFK